MMRKINKTAGTRWILLTLAGSILFFWLMLWWVGKPLVEESLRVKTMAAIGKNIVDFHGEVKFTGRMGIVRATLANSMERERLSARLAMLDLPGVRELRQELGLQPVEEEKILRDPWMHVEVAEDVVSIRGVMPKALRLQASPSQGRKLKSAVQSAKDVQAADWQEEAEQLATLALETMVTGEIRWREKVEPEVKGIFASPEDQKRFAAVLAELAPGARTAFDVLPPPGEPYFELVWQSGVGEISDALLPDVENVRRALDRLATAKIGGIEKVKIDRRVSSPSWVNSLAERVVPLNAAIESGKLSIGGTSGRVNGAAKPGQQLLVLNQKMSDLAVKDELNFEINLEVLEIPHLTLIWNTDEGGNRSVVTAEGALPVNLFADFWEETELPQTVNFSDLVGRAEWVDRLPLWASVTWQADSGRIEARGESLKIDVDVLDESKGKFIESQLAAADFPGMDWQVYLKIRENSQPMPIEEAGESESLAQKEKESEKLPPAPFLPSSQMPLPGGTFVVNFKGSDTSLSDSELERIEGIVQRIINEKYEGEVVVTSLMGPEESGRGRGLAQRRADEVWRLFVANGLDAERVQSYVYRFASEGEYSPGDVAVFASLREDGNQDEIEVAEEMLEDPENIELPIPETAESEQEEIGNIAGTIYFPHGTAMVKAAEKAAILEVYEKIKGQTGVHILATGFADNTGSSAEYNEWLSGERASHVRDELIRLGIPAARIKSQFKGSTGSALTEAEQAQNRRVEVTLIPR